MKTLLLIRLGLQMGRTDIFSKTWCQLSCGHQTGSPKFIGAIQPKTLTTHPPRRLSRMGEESKDEMGSISLIAVAP